MNIYTGKKGSFMNKIQVKTQLMTIKTYLILSKHEGLKHYEIKARNLLIELKKQLKKV